MSLSGSWGREVGYEQLDQRKALTLAKKDHLLMVLSHPEIPLHNNPAELGARQRVRKRDVSLQARTREGIGAWDTFHTNLRSNGQFVAHREGHRSQCKIVCRFANPYQTLVSTAKKLGVNIYQYLHDRLTQTNTFPNLATLIEERAKEFQFAASWRAVT